MSLFVSFFCFVAIASLLIFVFYDVTRDVARLGPMHIPVVLLALFCLLALGLISSGFAIAAYWR
jgi:uncharacterized membrane protein YsdA (DUF1294 family)